MEQLLSDTNLVLKMAQKMLILASLKFKPASIMHYEWRKSCCTQECAKHLRFVSYGTCCGDTSGCELVDFLSDMMTSQHEGCYIG